MFFLAPSVVCSIFSVAYHCEEDSPQSHSGAMVSDNSCSLPQPWRQSEEICLSLSLMQHQFHRELLWTFLEANWQYAPISIFMDHLLYARHLMFITLNPQKTLGITHVFESQLRSRVRLVLSRWSGTPFYARSTIAPALQRFTFCQTRSIS